MPISPGGRDGFGSLVPACLHCNLDKGDRKAWIGRLGRKAPCRREPPVALTVL
ncbi:HNH endonuclease [Streptomyces sp. YPW6]|uniref:HNH endonuclease n=1 Tax=Streptomyces sp. YPW6 TaxID=2840373 RepID=UPI001C0BE741|nr:HNH endonuclease [Streptomyces sp. YPW6]